MALLTNHDNSSSAVLDASDCVKDSSLERFSRIPSIFSGCGGQSMTNGRSEKNGRESGKYVLFLAQAAVHADKHTFSDFLTSSSFLSTVQA